MNLLGLIYTTCGHVALTCLLSKLLTQLFTNCEIRARKAFQLEYKQFFLWSLWINRSNQQTLEATKVLLQSHVFSTDLSLLLVWGRDYEQVTAAWAPKMPCYYPLSIKAGRLSSLSSTNWNGNVKSRFIKFWRHKKDAWAGNWCQSTCSYDYTSDPIEWP